MPIFSRSGGGKACSERNWWNSWKERKNHEQHPCLARKAKNHQAQFEAETEWPVSRQPSGLPAMSKKVGRRSSSRSAEGASEPKSLAIHAGPVHALPCRSAPPPQGSTLRAVSFSVRLSPTATAGGVNFVQNFPQFMLLFGRGERLLHDLSQKSGLPLR